MFGAGIDKRGGLGGEFAVGDTGVPSENAGEAGEKK